MVKASRLYISLMYLHKSPQIFKSSVVELDPDPDPSLIKQKKYEKTLISTVLRLLYRLLYLKTDLNVYCT